MQRCWTPVVQLYCKLHAGIPCPSPPSTTIFRSESGLYQFLSQWVAIEVSFLKITKPFELLWHKWELSFIIYSTIGCSWESKTLNSGPWPEGIAHIPLTHCQWPLSYPIPLWKAQPTLDREHRKPWGIASIINCYWKNQNYFLCQ